MTDVTNEDDEELEDYDSEEFDEDDEEEDEPAPGELSARNAQVSRLWDRYGFGEDREIARADAIATAHKMVQTFVDTFATDDMRYRVTFDPDFSTAGTDLFGKKIVITPTPLYDDRLTANEAGVILTAMATHEASHVRYGRSTAAAVQRVFGRKRSPQVLSNLLDDVRIERRFGDDYPGYRDVFVPMLKYIAENTAVKPRPKLSDMVNLAVLSIRYPFAVDWDDVSQEVRDERDWWKAWSEKWAKEDAPRRHVDGIREALKRIAEVKAYLAAQAEAERQKRKIAPARPMTPMEQALRNLTPIQRKAIRLASAGMKGAEISATLGIPQGDVRTALREVRTAIHSARIKQTVVVDNATKLFAAAQQVQP